MSEKDSVYRVTIRFSGEVQGVNFRERTRRIAQAFEVGGFVQNLPDGRVLLIAEGNREEVDWFVSSVKEKMGSLIADTEKSQEMTASPEYDEFTIRW